MNHFGKEYSNKSQYSLLKQYVKLKIIQHRVENILRHSIKRKCFYLIFKRHRKKLAIKLFLNYFIKNQHNFHTRTKNHDKRKCSKDKCIRNQAKIDSTIETEAERKNETNFNCKQEQEFNYRNNTDFTNDVDRCGNYFSKVQNHRKLENISSRKFEPSNPFQRIDSLGKWKYGERNKILEAGFTYTGHLDWLYCETCEVWTSYLEWIGEKTPAEAHNDLSPNCEYAKSLPQSRAHSVIYHRTVLHTKYAERYKGLLSFSKWQYGNTQSYDSLVDAGFFYKGWSDYTVCFCCGLWVAEWEKDEDPWIVHAKYCPGCIFLKKSKSSGYIKDVQEKWKLIYKPFRPDMEDESQRIKTFKLSDEYNGNKKAERLAKAGFFLECIAGEKLKVVCHYCNCNLELWINDCDPWVVHVKRMTECMFVEIRKGKKFISRILARLDDLQLYGHCDRMFVKYSEQLHIQYICKKYLSRDHLVRQLIPEALLQAGKDIKGKDTEKKKRFDLLYHNYHLYGDSHGYKND